MHVLFQIRPRLIIISFLVNQCPAWDISFNEGHRPLSANLFRGEAFSCLSEFSAWHDFGIWFSSVFSIMCLRSPTNKRRLVSFRSLKNDHVLAFLAVYSSAPIMVAVRLSPLTHTWLIESGILSWSCHLVLIGRVEEKRTFHSHYSWLLL